MRGYDSRLSILSSYQIHPSSINKTAGGSSSEDGVSSDVKSTTMSWHTRLTTIQLSGAKVFQQMRPKIPPNGIISSFLVLLSTIGIVAILLTVKFNYILILRDSTLSLPSEGVGNASFIPASKGVEPFVCSSEGDNKFAKSLHGFTSSFADGDSEKLNAQVHFNPDSIFFVCDNSTTGYICNDFRKFLPGSLCHSNKSLTTANGTGPCLQEGMVQLQLIDGEGMQHIFLLENCLYHPDSPVNLLSTRQLAEKFIDDQGNPDEQTKTESCNSTHVLTWSFGNFKKTFPTPVSGLPEILFDEGFQAYNSFCMQVSSYAMSDSAVAGTLILF